MKVVFNINKSLEQNAEIYFEKSKKLKKKIPGIKKIIDSSSTKLSSIKLPEKKEKIIRKKEWYEKFRWFVSSDGFLVIGGRDATTNEIIIKKYTEKEDIVLHTELAGSPFVIIKNPDKIAIPTTTINESAEFCASYSKSWKSGRGTAEVYHISPEQVTKETPTGTAALAKGSFMIYGKRNYIDARLNIAICSYDGKIMSGPISAIQKNAEEFIEIIPGTDKLSDVAKKIQKKIGGEIDEIVRALPPECTIKK